jgi:Tfp pilus assembly protein PilF
MFLSRKKLIWAAAGVILVTLVILGYCVLWPKYLLGQAEDAITADNLNQAETILREAISRWPKNARARFLLAQVLRRQGHPYQAEESLRKALRLGYPEKEGDRELALDEAAIRFRPALAHTLQKSLEENPNDVDSLEALEALARGYASIHEWQQAEAYFTRLIECHQGRSAWYWGRGKARQDAAFESGQGHALAAADFREVVRLDPDNLEAHLRLAQCWLSNAQMTEAKEELLRCRRLDPKRPEPLIGLATCAMEEQDWDQADNFLTKALEIQWNSLLALAMKGDLHLVRQQYSEAIPYFQKVLALDPTNKAAHLKLAQAYRSSGQLTDANNQEAAYQRLRLKEEKDSRGPSRP